MNKDEILEQLKSVDTPTITNAVATYPNDPNCLAIYNPWTENWYTDNTIKLQLQLFALVFFQIEVLLKLYLKYN